MLSELDNILILCYRGGVSGNALEILRWQSLNVAKVSAFLHWDSFPVWRVRGAAIDKMTKQIEESCSFTLYFAFFEFDSLVPIMLINYSFVLITQAPGHS